jgi:hypothetical protein
MKVQPVNKNWFRDFTMTKVLPATKQSSQIGIGI